MKSYELYKYEHKHIFKCVKCGRKEWSQKDINNHFKDSYDYLTCDKCEKQFVTISATHKHAYEHTEKASLNTCKDCGKTFPFPSQLQTHRKVHLTALEHHCIRCNKSFKKQWRTCQTPKCTLRKNLVMYKRGLSVQN